MWDFGDGGASTAKNPTYTYFDPGTFRIELTVTGPGGVSTYSQVVNSYPSPKANFQVSPTVVFVLSEVLLISIFRGEQPDGTRSKFATGGIGVTITECLTLSEQFALLTFNTTLKVPRPV